MPDYLLKKISEFVTATTTPFISGFLDIIDNGVNKKLSLSRLREDILNDSQLTGEPTTPTPNPGDDSQRIVNSEWVQDELAGLGLNPATSTEYGTVRTNSTDAVPTVYLKSEVDNLVTATKPVNQGGTGATSATEALTNLGAAARGNNNDITQLQALNAIPTVINTPLTSQGNRISTLESQNLNSRLTTEEGVNDTQDTRLNAIESLNTTQNSRLTSLESSETALQALTGLVQGFWGSLTAPANSSTTQFLIGSLSSSAANIPGWVSANVTINTIINVPVAGTYEVKAAVRVGPMSSNSTNKYRLSFMRQANGSATWLDQEFFGASFPGVGGAIDELWIHGSVPLALAAGDALRLGVLTGVNTGTVNVTGCRVWLVRIS